MTELIELIRSTFALEDHVDGDTPLLTSGLIDSFDVIVLVSALEDHYGVAVRTEDITAETFDTPRQIHTMVERGDS